MRYLLIVLLFVSFVGCRRVSLEAPVQYKTGDGEPLEEDTTRPDDFNERMRRICPF